MQITDKVLAAPSVRWAYGKKRGYDITPGVIIKVRPDVAGALYEVRWADGHESIHSADEIYVV